MDRQYYFRSTKSWYENKKWELKYAANRALSNLSSWSKLLKPHTVSFPRIISCSNKHHCEPTVPSLLTSKVNISAAHSVRLPLQLLLWQQKTPLVSICNQKCYQLFILLKKYSCQLLLFKKGAKCEHAPRHLTFQLYLSFSLKKKKLLKWLF